MFPTLPPAPVSEGLSPAIVGGSLALLALGGAAGNLYALCMGQAGLGGQALAPHLAQLAGADLLYLASIPFVVHNVLTGDWAFGDIGCCLVLALDLFAMHAAIFLLTGLGARRYQAVAYPLSPPPSWHGPAAAATAWVASGLLALPTVLMAQQKEWSGGQWLCGPGWSEAQARAYLTGLAGAGLLGPGLALAIMSGRLIQLVDRSGKGLRRHGRELGRGSLRLFALTGAAVLVFWACYLPFWAWQVVPLYWPEPFDHLTPATQAQITHAVTALTYVNSCLYPIIYTVLGAAAQTPLAKRRQQREGEVIPQGNLDGEDW